MIAHAFRSVSMAVELLAYSAVAFAALSLLVKGRTAIEGARRALPETFVNLSWGLLDALLVGPFLALAVSAIRYAVDAYSLHIVTEQTWTSLGKPLTVFMVLFLGDFISYWRHRLEHTRLVWPAHAIHHSDTQMTFLTRVRFHPVNRATTTCIDIMFLAMLGFPFWSLLVYEIVRHYYAEFVHADLPWTYGPLGRLFVSPVMHQWHHARDVERAGYNFANVFSVFDQVFGTYYVPGLCNVPLGVKDDIGHSVARQFLYPFICWFKSLRRAFGARRAFGEIDPA